MKDYSNDVYLFEVASSYALSFKGYEYMLEKQFDNFSLQSCEAFRNGENISSEDMLPALFSFQRSISRDPRDEEQVKAFFKLFIKCIDLGLEIPERYRDDRYFPEWEKNQEHIEEIKKAINKNYN